MYSAGLTGERVSAIGETYQLYRVSKLKYRLHPTTNGAVQDPVYAAFVPAGVAVDPTGVNDIVELPGSVRMAGNNTSGVCVQTIPSNWYEVPAVDLRGPLPWYKTVGSASVDSWEENQGLVYVRSSTAGGVQACLEVQGEVQFMGAVDPALSAKAAEVARAKERERLLSLLADTKLASGSATLEPAKAGPMGSPALATFRGVRSAGLTPPSSQSQG